MHHFSSTKLDRYRHGEKNKHFINELIITKTKKKNEPLKVKEIIG